MMPSMSTYIALYLVFFLNFLHTLPYVLACAVIFVCAYCLLGYNVFCFVYFLHVLPCISAFIIYIVLKMTWIFAYITTDVCICRPMFCFCVLILLQILSYLNLFQHSSTLPPRRATLPLCVSCQEHIGQGAKAAPHTSYVPEHPK